MAYCLCSDEYLHQYYQLTFSEIIPRLSFIGLLKLGNTFRSRGEFTRSLKLRSRSLLQLDLRGTETWNCSCRSCFYFHLFIHIYLSYRFPIKSGERERLVDSSRVAAPSLSPIGFPRVTWSSTAWSRAAHVTWGPVSRPVWRVTCYQLLATAVDRCSPEASFGAASLQRCPWVVLSCFLRVRYRNRINSYPSV